jgi:hypothetical protein
MGSTDHCRSCETNAGNLKDHWKKVKKSLKRAGNNLLLHGTQWVLKENQGVCSPVEIRREVYASQTVGNGNPAFVRTADGKKHFAYKVAAGSLAHDADGRVVRAPGQSPACVAWDTHDVAAAMCRIVPAERVLTFAEVPYPDDLGVF